MLINYININKTGIKVAFLLSCFMALSVFAQQKPKKEKVVLKHADLTERNPKLFEGNNFYQVMLSSNIKVM